MTSDSKQPPQPIHGLKVSRQPRHLSPTIEFCDCDGGVVSGVDSSVKSKFGLYDLFLSIYSYIVPLKLPLTWGEDQLIPPRVGNT